VSECGAKSPEQYMHTCKPRDVVSNLELIICACSGSVTSTSRH
jgi:hypothetical protein